MPEQQPYIDWQHAESNQFDTYGYLMMKVTLPEGQLAYRAWIYLKDGRTHWAGSDTMEGCRLQVRTLGMQA